MENNIYIEKSNPKISVIIPVYNVEKYLRECLDSIIKQSYRNLEVIVVDDGSTDGSGSICDEYRSGHENIEVIHKVNGGLSDARNVGLEVASGELISFVDSDDVLSVVYYETIVEALNNTNTELAIIVQGVPFWDDDIPMLTEKSGECDYYLMNSREALLDMFYFKIATGAPFKIIRREVLNDIRFPVGVYYEDIATTYKLYRGVKDVVVVNGALYGYRKRRDSIIRQPFSEKKMSILDVAERVFADIDKYNDKELMKACRYRLFPSLFSVFLQIPCEDQKNRERIWGKICELRKDVLFERRSIRKKDRIAAAVSYFGMNVSYHIGRRFGQKGTFSTSE